MISLRQLYWIDQRCRQIFPESRNVPFGGLNIILAGDFYQLPPVFNKPLYYTGKLVEVEEQQAHHLYYRFYWISAVMASQQAYRTWRYPEYDSSTGYCSRLPPISSALNLRITRYSPFAPQTMLAGRISISWADGNQLQLPSPLESRLDQLFPYRSDRIHDIQSACQGQYNQFVLEIHQAILQHHHWVKSLA